ncbi:DUF397 domain-containing protein [Amycolatopsis sp. NPDC101161]|uniref:DUF397 domain-containing protein n=1 Tax=Amycolatopsis sp. NPDC101161 TaxID=3363940 RepID=UPI0038074BB0
MTEKPPANHKEWFQSSHSGHFESCVEVRFEPERALVRDSDNSHHDSPCLEFSAPAWKAFLGLISHEHEHER